MLCFFHVRALAKLSPDDLHVCGCLYERSGFSWRFNSGFHVSFVVAFRTFVLRSLAHCLACLFFVCTFLFFALSRNSISIRDLRIFLRTHSCICSPLYDGSGQVIAISHAAYLMVIRIASLFNYLLHVYSLNSLLADLPSHRTFVSSLL